MFCLAVALVTVSTLTRAQSDFRIDYNSFLDINLWNGANGVSVFFDPTSDSLFLTGCIMFDQRLSWTAKTPFSVQTQYGDGFVMRLSRNLTIEWTWVGKGPIDFRTNGCMIEETGQQIFCVFRSTANYRGIQNFDPTGRTNDVFYYSLYAKNGSHRWLQHLGSMGDDFCWNGAILPGSEFFYLIGASTASIDSQMHYGGYDAWISKGSRNNGSRFWTLQFGSSTDDALFSIEYHPADETLFLTGSYGSTIDGQRYIGNSRANCILIKSSLNGSRIYSRLFGNGPDHCVPFQIAIDDQTDHLFIAGIYDQVYSVTDESAGFRSSYGFWSKFKMANGTLVYQHLNKDYIANYNIAISLINSSVIIFGFTAEPLFDDTNIPHGGVDLFIAVFDSNGTYKWSYQWGSELQDTQNFVYYDRTVNLFYITGNYQASALCIIQLNYTDIQRYLPFPDYVPKLSVSFTSSPTITLTADQTHYSSNTELTIIGFVFGACFVLFLVSLVFWICRKMRSRTKLQRNSWKVSETNAGEFQMNTVIFEDSGEATQSVTFQGFSLPGELLLSGKFYESISVLYSRGKSKILKAKPTLSELRERLPKGQENHQLIVVKLSTISHPLEKFAFRQEVTLMNLFRNHSEFVRIIGFSENPYAIVTEFYPLGSLDKLLQINPAENGKKLDFEISKLLHVPRCMKQTIRFGQQITRGISKMHQVEIAHCDLKPHNIFMELNSKTGEYDCRIGDLGIARILDETKSLVKAYQIQNVKGLTIAYAAPERIREMRHSKTSGSLFGQNARLFKSSDIFSLALVLYELLVWRIVWSLEK